MSNNSSSSGFSPPNSLNASLSPPTSPESSYKDDSSEIDELDYRSRRLTQLLRKNVDKANNRKSLLDVVKKRAWLLDNHVDQLEEQTRRAKVALGRQPFKRRLIMFGAFMSSIVLIGFGFNHIASSSKEA